MQMLCQSAKKECDNPNHRTVSILSNISKIYEKIICNKLREYFKGKYLQVNVDFVREIVLNIPTQLLSYNGKFFKKLIHKINLYGALLTDSL